MIDDEDHWRVAPQHSVEPDWAWFGSPEKIGAMILPSSHYQRDLVVNGRYYPAFPRGTTQGGIGFALANDGDFITLDADADNVFGGNSCTMLIVRVLRTKGTGSAMHGYISGADRVDVNLPFSSDDKIYWSYGNSSVGSGRVATAAAQTWTLGAVDAFALSAGAIYGREIIRNGALIANDASATAARNTTTAGMRWGSIALTSHVTTELFFAVIKEEWDRAKREEWTRAPFASLRQIRQRTTFIGIPAAGGSFNPAWAAAANSVIQPARAA